VGSLSALTVADGDGAVEITGGLNVIVGEDTAASDSVADAVAFLADVTGDAGGDAIVGFNDGEVAYIAIETDAGDTAIYELIDSDADVAIVAGDLTHMVTLTGVSTEDLVAANFADFV
jgi:hypothetical protein